MNDSDVYKVIELYKKERKHETLKFGDYEKIESLNLASFLLLIEEYVNRAKKAYSSKWSSELPPWLKDCAENKLHGTAPVEAYEEVIKIMALAGAALETYCETLPDGWRQYIDHFEE